MDLTELREVLSGGKKLVEMFAQTQMGAMTALVQAHKENLEVVDMCDGIAKLKKREQKSAEALSELKETEAECQARLDKIKKEIEQLQEAKAYRVKELQFAQKLYEQHFGLRFVSNKDGDVRLVFKQIDPRAPDREFYFALHVDDQTRHYQVTECQPALHGYEKFVAEVNSTNDFSLFVRRMRRLFQQSL